MLLKDKICIVTGAGKGLGKEIAKEFYAQGAKLSLITRSQSDVDDLISEFDNTMIDLKDNVSKEKNKMYEIEEKLSVVRTRCRANQLKLDQEIEQESKLQSRLREENLRLNQAKDRFEVQA